MKKLALLMAAVLLMFSLTACLGTNTSTTSATTATGDEAEPSSYAKDFKGLKSYLIDSGLVSSDAASEIYYDIIGASDGVRYTLSGSAFIEFYDFSGARDDTADSILADIEDDGKFTAIDGLDELTGVISASGSYVAAYNAVNNYDYASLTDVLENW